MYDAIRIQGNDLMVRPITVPVDDQKYVVFKKNLQKYLHQSTYRLHSHWIWQRLSSALQCSWKGNDPLMKQLLASQRTHQQADYWCGHTFYTSTLSVSLFIRSSKPSEMTPVSVCSTNKVLKVALKGEGKSGGGGGGKGTYGLISNCTADSSPGVFYQIVYKFKIYFKHIHLVSLYLTDQNFQLCCLAAIFRSERKGLTDFLP